MAVMTTKFEQAWFDLCEFETDPFTRGELAALTRYEKAVEGVPGCFGCYAPDMFADGMSQCEAAGIFRAWSGLLNNWREATRTLQEELTDGQALNTADRRYLEYGMTGWKPSQDEHRPMVSEDRHGSDMFAYVLTTLPGSPRPSGTGGRPLAIRSGSQDRAVARLGG